jgi:hypothetical protein
MPEKVCRKCYLRQPYEHFALIDNPVHTRDAICIACRRRNTPRVTLPEQETPTIEIEPDTTTTQQCRRCKRSQTLDAFPVYDTDPAVPLFIRISKFCHACTTHRAQVKSRKDRSSRQREQIRILFPHAYDELYAAQEGCCAIFDILRQLKQADSLSWRAMSCTGSEEYVSGRVDITLV